jgi:hypothetical protein
MNNTTIERIEIKMRGDNVYDIYVNDEWIGSRGCYLNALNFVREYIQSQIVCENIVK